MDVNGNSTDWRLAAVIATAILLTALLVPVGVQAAANLVTIKDSNSAAKAQVEDGALRVVDGAERRPMQETIDITVNSPQTNGSDTFTVPAGFILVIEQVAFRCANGTATDYWYFVRLDVRMNITEYNHYLLPEKIDDFQCVVSQPVKAYAGPGTVVSLVAGRTGNAGTSTLQGTVSGHLVKL